MNHVGTRFRGLIYVWTALAASWLLASPALAQLAPSRTHLVTVSCEHADATDVARMLKEILKPDTGYRVSVDERSNSVLVFGAADEVELAKQLIKSVDVPVVPAGDQELRVISLRQLAPDRSLEEALQVVFGGSSASTRGRFALDRQRNLVIVQGDSGILKMVEALVARLEAGTVKPAESKPTEVQIRIVWLVSGLAREDVPKPPPDLQEVAAELAKIGIAEPRLAAQTVIRAAVNEPFQSNGSAMLNSLCQLRISGKVVDRPGQAPGLQISLDATQERATGTSTRICQLETSITAPPGHAVVLGVTPTEGLTSAFVVQVRPLPTPAVKR